MRLINSKKYNWMQGTLWYRQSKLKEVCQSRQLKPEPLLQWHSGILKNCRRWLQNQELNDLESTIAEVAQLKSTNHTHVWTRGEFYNNINPLKEGTKYIFFLFRFGVRGRDCYAANIELHFKLLLHILQEENSGGNFQDLVCWVKYLFRIRTMPNPFASTRILASKNIVLQHI